MSETSNLTSSFVASRLAPDFSKGFIAFVLLDAIAQCKADEDKKLKLLKNISQSGSTIILILYGVIHLMLITNFSP